MNSLIVFAKAPIPGKVKTRLSPPLSSVQAARLYTAFVGDVIAGARACGAASVTVAYEAHRAYPDLRWIEDAPAWFPQSGKDLGARMSVAFAAAFAGGASKTVLIGSDCPDLDPRVLRRGFALLDEAEAVLGPAEDGGYYLVGLREPMPGLFSRMEWSTPDVLARTLSRLNRLGARCALLPEHADVDTFDDLRALGKRLAAGGGRAPRSYEAVRDLVIDSNSRRERAELFGRVDVRQAPPRRRGDERAIRAFERIARTEPAAPDPSRQEIEAFRLPDGEQRLGPPASRVAEGRRARGRIPLRNEEPDQVVVDGRHVAREHEPRRSRREGVGRKEAPRRSDAGAD